MKRRFLIKGLFALAFTLVLLTFIYIYHKSALRVNETNDSANQPALILSAERNVLAKGETLKVFAMYTADGGIVNWNDHVQWYISPPQMAMMIQPGVVFAREAGRFQIWASTRDPELTSNSVTVQVWHNPTRLPEDQEK